ncbi:MAG: 6-hydroxymethylpterin diphosphokinase MptE-like protein [Methylococcales bacterium]
MSNESTAINGSVDLGQLKINSFGERYFYGLNRGSFDKVSANALYEAELSKNLFKSNTLKVIIGTDSGLLPRYINQKGIPSGSRYLFIEPDEILTQLHAHHLLDELPPEICCTSLANWEEQAEVFKIAEYFYISAVQSLNSVCAQEANFEDYTELSWLITEKLNQAHWNFSMSLGCEGFIVRQMSNLADNLLPAGILTDAYKGQTAVILAGGPSLDEAFSWVKQNRDKITLFAVSRIARQLQQQNIEPDFICSVDPSDLSFDISKEMLNFSDKTIFLYSFHTVSTLVQQWQGTALYLGERLPWKSPLNQKNISGAGPTVTNTAIATAHKFGFKRIILAGVDLCFTREGYTHAQGSNEALAGPRFNLTSLQVETNNGQFAPTSCDFLTAINSLAMQAHILTNSGCELINPAANAAKIEHIAYTPWSAMQLPPNLTGNTTDITGQLQTAQQQAVNDRHLMLAELQHAQHQIKTIQTLAEEALQINDNLYNAQGIIENYKDKRKLDKIEQKLKRQYRKFSVMVKKFGVRHFIKITRPFEDMELTAEDAKELCNLYYTAYRDGAKTFLGLIENAIARTHSRLEETRTQPDFEKLLPQWQKDQSFGRAIGWQSKFKQPLTDEIQTILQDFVTQFHSVIADQNTPHLAQAKRFSSLSAFKNRAKLLFKHGKITELYDLKAGLDKHPEPESTRNYQHLATAYIADLEGDTSSALEAYRAIIDGGDSSLYEDALMRIAQISLNTEDHQNAYLALQCLAQLSPVHLPLYAEINRLFGNTEEAIGLYYDYLNQFPRDTLVQLKLAALHIENKAYNIADVMLRFILTKDPDSKAALALQSQIQALQNISEGIAVQERQHFEGGLGAQAHFMPGS